MRLWHQSLLSVLPDNQLTSQHRECCALRGKGWGKKHSTVDYVFEHDMESLIAYHYLVMHEMEKRGKWPNLDKIWYTPQYRGKILGMDQTILSFKVYVKLLFPSCIYSEHDYEYLVECIINLRTKLYSKISYILDLDKASDIGKQIMSLILPVKRIKLYIAQVNLNTSQLEVHQVKFLEGDCNPAQLCVRYNGDLESKLISLHQVNKPIPIHNTIADLPFTYALGTSEQLAQSIMRDHLKILLMSTLEDREKLEKMALLSLL